MGIRVTIKIDLPRVHMAGSDAHYNGHLEVGEHGIAVFLAPEAEFPVMDVGGTPEQLDEMVRELQAALSVTRESDPDRDAAQMNLLPSPPYAQSRP